MNKEQITITVATIKVALARRTKQIKYLQPYYKQGNRWYKLKAKVK